MIHFLGTSHAALTLKEGARRRGLKITEDIKEADLVFVSEDAWTDANGVRDLTIIRLLIEEAKFDAGAPIVVTSQVPPGFMRRFGHWIGLYHQAETLRIEDGLQRATFPEMFIVGCYNSGWEIHPAYMEYLKAFDCPIIKMTYEEAEFTKMAINAFLISQVETTNMLSERAAMVGADWGKICQALRHDSRIGKYAYLTPGKWQNSKHLLRDYVTLCEIKINKLLEAWK